MTSTTYQVSGMTCEHCVRAVRSEVSGIDGVDQVDVDLSTGAVTVLSDAPLAHEDVLAAVDEAGYTVVGQGVAT